MTAPEADLPGGTEETPTSLHRAVRRRGRVGRGTACRRLLRFGRHPLVVDRTASPLVDTRQRPSTSAAGPAPSAPGSTPTSAASSASGDWAAYHHDAARTGVSSDQLPLGTVRRAWVSAALDGALYAEPLVVGDRVLAATEGNSVYAIDAASGSIVWRAALGEPVAGSDLPCGNIDPSGITGTPVVDPSTRTMYVVAFLRSGGPHHELFALDLGTGAIRWRRAIDPPGLSPLVEQQRGALALAGGRVYVPYGGLAGDCGPYRGAVVSAATDGAGPLTHYTVPTRRMAGIWNPAGPVVDSTGDLWVTTGNSDSQGAFDFGNAVIRLSPDLTVRDYFAPADWRSLNATDADLGSLGPVLLPGDRVLAVGKTGAAYLLDRRHLGNVGRPLATARLGSAAFGAAATLGSTAFVPFQDALMGVQTTGDRIAVVWRLPRGSGPPIVAAGAVWSLGRDGVLRALDAASGTVRFTSRVSRPVSRFVSLSAAGGRLFVADGTRIAAFSLR